MKTEVPLDALRARLMTDPEPEVRRVAASSLRQRGGDEAIAALVERTRKGDTFDVMTQAARGLSDLGGPQAWAELARLLTLERDFDGDAIASVARDGLKRAGPAGVPFVVQVLAAPNWKARFDAVTVLDGVHAYAEAAAVELLVEDSEPAVRGAAKSFLAHARGSR